MVSGTSSSSKSGSRAVRGDSAPIDVAGFMLVVDLEALSVVSDFSTAVLSSTCSVAFLEAMMMVSLISV